MTFQLHPARVYIEDTFVYYIKTLFYTYIPDGAKAETRTGQNHDPMLPEQVSVSIPYQ